MFEKLLSQLPYNPSLIHQMGFYGRRMREEAAIRRTGMVFVVLAFMVQFFAVVAPPAQSSAATGPNNNLLQNGFSSPADAAKKCNNNTQDYKSILSTYGITCDQISKASVIQKFNPNSNGGKLFSMGRFSYPNLKGNQPVTITGSARYGSTYYVRYLSAWGNGDYKALKLTASTGKTYWLLYGCGNLVSIGVPIPVVKSLPPPHVVIAPAPAPPKLSITKSMRPGYPAVNSSVAPGTTLGYRIDITNSGGSAANNVVLKDNLPNDTAFVSQSLNAGATVHTYNGSTKTADWQWGSISAKNSGNYTVLLNVKINSNAPNGDKICNFGTISATGLGAVKSNQVCVTVVKNAPPPPVTPVCQYNSALPATSPSCKPPTPAPVCQYNRSLPASSPSCKPPTTPVCQYNNALPANSSSCKPPTTTPSCLYDTSLPATSPDCKPCQASVTTTDLLSCVAVSKSALNQTENVADANNTTAQPGDVIVYTLSAQNDAHVTVSKYVFDESLGDVMVYADPVDLDGGTLDSTTGMITWPGVDITAGATATKTVTVKVKNPIPAAVTDPADPAQYDLTMTNVYGNTINIQVPQPPAQSVVTASASLPNTGPGTGLFIFAAIMVVGSYFYSRSRLLAHESSLAVKSVSIG